MIIELYRRSLEKANQEAKSGESMELSILGIPVLEIYVRHRADAYFRLEFPVLLLGMMDSRLPFGDALRHSPCHQPASED